MNAAKSAVFPKNVCMEEKPMAQLNYKLNGSFNGWLNRIEDGILNGSASASLEARSESRMGDVRCSVRVFERYSWMGGNRVSMTVVLFGNDNAINLTAVTSGGSQAMFVKINTFGEEAFLDCLREILEM